MQKLDRTDSLILFIQVLSPQQKSGWFPTLRDDVELKDEKNCFLQC